MQFASGVNTFDLQLAFFTVVSELNPSRILLLQLYKQASEPCPHTLWVQIPRLRRIEHLPKPRLREGPLHDLVLPLLLSCGDLDAAYAQLRGHTTETAAAAYANAAAVCEEALVVVWYLISEELNQVVPTADLVSFLEQRCGRGGASTCSTGA